jgi:4-carboxymuconolactone decarboxylase
MSDNSYEAGRKIAVQMWGEEVAAARESRASDLNRPFEDLVTKYCFGEVWAEETLDPKTRSMITLAVLTALTKPNQLKVHVRGAIANGVSVEEIRAILIHSAVYSGVPAGVEAFNAAKEVLVEMDLDG